MDLTDDGENGRLATFMPTSIAAALPFYLLIEWNMNTIGKKGAPTTG
jgi:hypothetical protein